MQKRTLKILLTLATISALITKAKAETDQSTLGNTCAIDVECSPPYITCREGKCAHKALFPMEPKEIFGMVILLILCLLAAASGIGGGAIIVPILLIFYDFSTKEAIAFSNGMIFFSAIVKFFVGIKMKHPLLSYKTMIDYNVVMIFISTLLLGSFIGSSIASIVPSFLQLVGLIIVIIFSMLKSFLKSLKLWKIETTEFAKEMKKMKRKTQRNEKKNEKEKEVVDSKSKPYKVTNSEPEVNKIPKSPTPEGQGEIREIREIEETVKKNNDNHNGSHLSVETEEIEYTEKEKEIHKFLTKVEGNNFYWKKTLVSFGILCISMLIIFLRGGKGMDSIIGVHKCDTADWILIIIYGVIVIIFMLVGDIIVLREQNLKLNYRWPNLGKRCEKNFPKKFIIKANIISFLVGIIAALVGVGGGMITNPILLGMNFLPQVVSFTGMYPTVINKLVATTIFLVAGQVPLDYLMFTGCLLVVGVIIVEWKVAQIVKKFGRQSIISFLFAGILAVSLVLTVYIGIRNTKSTLDDGKKLFEFKKYCE